MALIIEAPTRQTPGFAKRNKQILMMQQRIKENDPTAWDTVIALLAPFVIAHTGYDTAEDALWDASEEQLIGALKAMSGNSTTP